MPNTIIYARLENNDAQYYSMVSGDVDTILNEVIDFFGDDIKKYQITYEKVKDGIVFPAKSQNIEVDMFLKHLRQCFYYHEFEPRKFIYPIYHTEDARIVSFLSRPLPIALERGVITKYVIPFLSHRMKTFSFYDEDHEMNEDGSVFVCGVNTAYGTVSLYNLPTYDFYVEVTNIGSVG